METNFKKELETELLITIEEALSKHDKKATININKQVRSACKQLAKKFIKAVKKEKKKSKPKKNVTPFKKAIPQPKKSIIGKRVRSKK
jgi:putative IMPACT (imprinted ancient) family translation regulator